MPFDKYTRVVPSNIVLDRGPDPPTKRGDLGVLEIPSSQRCRISANYFCACYPKQTDLDGEKANGSWRISRGEFNCSRCRDLDLTAGPRTRVLIQRIIIHRVTLVTLSPPQTACSTEIAATAACYLFISGVTPLSVCSNVMLSTLVVTRAKTRGLLYYYVDSCSQSE